MAIALAVLGLLGGAVALWAPYQEKGSPDGSVVARVELPVPNSRPPVSPQPPQARAPASPSLDASRATAVEATPPSPPPSAEVVLPLNVSAEVKRTAATQLRTRAGSLFKQKKFALALPLFELSERLDPDSPDGAERLGATLARTGDSIRAVYFYNRFLELAPNDPLAHDLKEDVDSWMVDHPNPALETMRIGVMRPLGEVEARLQSELARRMTNTSNPEADLDWFLAEQQRLDGGSR